MCGKFVIFNEKHRYFFYDFFRSEMFYFLNGLLKSLKKHRTEHGPQRDPDITATGDSCSGCPSYAPSGALTPCFLNQNVGLKNLKLGLKKLKFCPE